MCDVSHGDRVATGPSEDHWSDLRSAAAPHCLPARLPSSESSEHPGYSGAEEQSKVGGGRLLPGRLARLLNGCTLKERQKLSFRKQRRTLRTSLMNVVSHAEHIACTSAPNKEESHREHRREVGLCLHKTDTGAISMGTLQ